eukprot:TRINITY_DN10305_c0_g1_i2.p1 TRINITY_DN10305_c0_g1~~TRINITY_DN10305_c0_g1_i2.p1  ORF type:complete len:298 (-),score=59.64 TRINITY_DN10305_c0_g1_i2:107-1000(-)
MQKAGLENIALAIHGGAGGIHSGVLSEEMAARYKDKLNEVLLKAYAILSKGGSSIDAVEAAIVLMEECTFFDAGKGSVPNSKGEVEMDASIMDGTTHKAGAVAGVKTIKHPISLARLVSEQTPHVMLTGNGADAFGHSLGMETVTKHYFTEEPRYWQLVEDGHKGTVGAVALDGKGNIAAGTSTGGSPNRMAGRVGDSPIIGAGTFADSQSCGVSCTGVGEFYIRGVVAHNIAAMKQYKGISLEEAVKQTLKEKVIDLGGVGGIAAVDNKGNITFEYNTPGMLRAHIKGDGIPYVSF